MTRRHARPSPASRILFLAIAMGLGCQSAPSDRVAGGSGTHARSATPSAVATTSSVAPPTAAASAGRVESATFTSTALGVEKRFNVYLPAGYDEGTTRYPVVYLLHGLGGNEDDWVEGGDVVASSDALGLQALVVMPDGDAGFYTNWAETVDRAECLSRQPRFSSAERPETYCVERAAYEDYIKVDLVRHIDERYRTRPGSASRAIAGLSMGGYGALALAMRNPTVFSAAASHSGIASLLYEGPHPFAAGQSRRATHYETWGQTYPEAFREHMRKVFGPDLSAWRDHDPAVLAERARPGEIALYLDCGTEDGFQLQDGAAHLDEVLSAHRIEHAFFLVPGRHDFALWRDRVRESLAFFARHFRGGTKP